MTDEKEWELEEETPEERAERQARFAAAVAPTKNVVNDDSGETCSPCDECGRMDCERAIDSLNNHMPSDDTECDFREDLFFCRECGDNEVEEEDTLCEECLDLALKCVECEENEVDEEGDTCEDCQGEEDEDE